MPTTIRADVAKNRLYIILDGPIGEEESRANLPRIDQEAKQLEAGFSVITDTTGCKPTTMKVKEDIEAVQADLMRRGMKHVIRAIGNNAISALQLDRGAREAGYGSNVKVDTVATMADAERLIK
ncbi:MAG: hypothetical protein ABSD38_39070 [Syntrophorhabdales bacterium]